MSQRHYPQPQLHVGLVIADLFGYFRPILCSNVCKEVGPQSIETVKLRFFRIVLRVTFLRLVYFIQSVDKFYRF